MFDPPRKVLHHRDLPLLTAEGLRTDSSFQRTCMSEHANLGASSGTTVVVWVSSASGSFVSREVFKGDTAA